MLACAVALAHGVSTRGQVPKRISGNNCYRYPDGREITLIEKKNQCYWKRNIQDLKDIVGFFLL